MAREGKEKAAEIRRNFMDYQKVLLGATGSISDDDKFKRSDLLIHIISMGYSERTALNELTPSRKGGMINNLLAIGAIEKYGPLGYRIVDASLVAAKKDKREIVRNYEGSPREGWEDIGLMSDPDTHPVSWRLCGDKYDGGYNLKLYAKGVVPHKANYWLRYSGGKISGPDAATLRAHHRDIYDNVLSDMRELANV